MACCHVKIFPVCWARQGRCSPSGAEPGWGGGRDPGGVRAGTWGPPGQGPLWPRPAGERCRQLPPSPPGKVRPGLRSGPGPCSPPTPRRPAHPGSGMLSGIRRCICPVNWDRRSLLRGAGPGHGREEVLEGEAPRRQMVTCRAGARKQWEEKGAQRRPGPGPPRVPQPGPGLPAPSKAGGQRDTGRAAPKTQDGLALHASRPPRASPAAEAPAPRCLDAAPLTSAAGPARRERKSSGRARNAPDGKIPLPPVVEVRVLRRAPSAARPAALPGLPRPPHSRGRGAHPDGTGGSRLGRRARPG